MRILLTVMAMESFLKRLVGGRRSFRDLGMGETAALSLSKGMRSPASPKRDVNKSLKKPAREPRNERNDFMAYVCFNPNHISALRSDLLSPHGSLKSLSNRLKYKKKIFMSLRTA